METQPVLFAEKSGRAAPWPKAPPAPTHASPAAYPKPFETMRDDIRPSQSQCPHNAGRLILKSSAAALRLEGSRLKVRFGRYRNRRQFLVEEFGVVVVLGAHGFQQRIHHLVPGLFHVDRLVERVGV